MACKAELLFLALCALSAFGSIYHGPTAKPVVLKSGYLADTHDVAAAKGAHLAALVKESHYGHGGDYSGKHSHGNDYLSYSHGQAVIYHGPTAKPVVLKSGYLADTHEVAAAKDAHLDALAKQSQYGQEGGYSQSYSHGNDDISYNHGKAVQYHGPTANPVVLKSGYLADTYEVAAAKSAHLAAITKQAYCGQVDHSSGSYTHEVDYDNSFVHDQNIKYHVPTAIPHVLKNGHIKDTHVVTAAKAEHYAAVAIAKTHDGYGNSYVYSRHQ